jgi:hypothetical protein
MGYGVKQHDVTTILARVETLPTQPADNTLVLAIKAATDKLPTVPANEVTSQAIEDKTDNLPVFPADQVRVSKLMPWLDLWSTLSAQVQLTTSPLDKPLPSISIAGLPSGVSIARAIMMLVFRTLENTNAAQNYVSGAQNIQVEKSPGGSWITGIALAGGELDVPASTRETGTVLMGTDDISSQVPANGTSMNFKWTSAVAAANNLNFNDVQVGIRIWFTV